MTKDYYKILGVQENASQDEIKKSYRTLSKQYHPDVNPEGKERFQEIAEAYDILGDEKKRKEFDMMKNSPFSNMGPDMGDIFDLFNRGFNPFSGNRRQRAPDKVVLINLTPFESYLGVTKSLNYQKKEKCVSCDGHGGDRVTCTTCGGRGVIQNQFDFGGAIHIQNSNCPTCNGSGSFLTTRCFSCTGHGVKQVLHSIKIDIPKSVDDGDFLRVPNSGDFTPNQGVGDLVVQIKMINDGVYQKIGPNLFLNYKMSPESIFLREDIKFEHPEGQLAVKFPNKFNTITPIRLKGKGFYSNEGRGDFIIKFDIDSTLSKLTEEKIFELENILKK